MKRFVLLALSLVLAVSPWLSAFAQTSNPPVELRNGGALARANGDGSITLTTKAGKAVRLTPQPSLPLGPCVDGEWFYLANTGIHQCVNTAWVLTIQGAVVSNAGVHQKGIIELSTAAADPTRPIAASVTDPRITETRNSDEWPDFPTAISSIGIVTPTTLVVSSVESFTGATVTPNITLDVKAGGRLDNSQALAVQGDIIAAENQRIFGGAGSVTLRPGAYSPMWFGVKNDAVLSTDGAMTTGSAVLTSASRSCVATDAGKSVIVYAAGSLSSHAGFNNPLRTTVSSCSGTSFVLAASASATVSNTRWVYGSSNTTLMQRAANSLTSGGILSPPPGSYMMGGVTLLSGVTIQAVPESTMFYSTSTSVFLFSNQSKINIIGLSFDAGGNPASMGSVTIVGGTNVSDIRVLHCDFLDTFLLNNGNSVPVDTFNRHGVLLRNGARWKVLFNDFGPAMRVKAAGTGDSRDFEIAHNNFDRTNENGISLLSNDDDSVVSGGHIHHNILRGVIESGYMISVGDDGNGGPTQEMSNVRIEHNEMYGPFAQGTGGIINRGNAVQRNIFFNHNSCDNLGQANVNEIMCINNANQTDAGNPTVNFQAIGNVASGPFEYASFRFGSIASGVISKNEVYRTDNAGRGMRFGEVFDTVVSDNVIVGAAYGLYVNNSLMSRVSFNNNRIVLAARNDGAGIYIEPRTTSGPMTDVVFFRTRITLPGGTFERVRAIQDDENGGGDTNAVAYLESSYSGIPTGAGSRAYETLPANAVVTEEESTAVHTLTDLSATPTVRGKRDVLASNTAPTSITNFQHGYTNKRLTVRFTNGNTTLVNGATILLAGAANFTGTANDTITLVFNGTAWYEVARSVN